MAERITGRLPDGTAYVRSETGKEGVGYHTTQRRLPEIVTKPAKLEDKIENGNLVEVVHGEWKEWFPPPQFIMTGEEMLYRCSCCDAKYADIEGYKYCPYCGAKMDGDKNG